MRKLLAASALVLAASVACGGGEHDLAASEGDALTTDPVGSIDGNGQWGAATTCKPLPTGLPTLRSPRVVISLDGLTLHLWDQGGTFDKVYPIGPGAIENGKSLTPV